MELKVKRTTLTDMDSNNTHQTRLKVGKEHEKEKVKKNDEMPCKM